MGRKRKYKDAEESKKAHYEKQKVWRAQNREKVREYYRKWHAAKRLGQKFNTRKPKKVDDTSPIYTDSNERLTEKQKAILKRIATAVTADDID